MGCGVWGVGCGVWGVGCGVCCVGHGAWDLVVEGLGVGVRGWARVFGFKGSENRGLRLGFGF